MPSSFAFFEVFTEDLAKKVHDLDGDTLRVYLSNTAPDAAADEVLADLAEIGTGFGYSAGGEDTQNAVTRSGATSSVVGTDIVWTAAGGAIGPFRYAVLVNATPTSPLKPLIGWWDYGSSITLLDTETFTTDFGASLFTIG